MKIHELSPEDLTKVSGGTQNSEENLNEDDSLHIMTCQYCGKKWDNRDYFDFSGNDPMPNWLTAPWCPECGRKQREEFFKKDIH